MEEGCTVAITKGKAQSARSERKFTAQGSRRFADDTVHAA